MKIVIIGAGQVGASVAEALAGEANDIVLIDVDGNRLAELRDRLDIQTVQGHGAHTEILEKAGLEDADMLLAVSNRDTINIVACQIAHSLFHTPTKLARIRSQDYLRHAELFSESAMPVDKVISPEQAVTEYIQRLIEHPGALQVLDFADGRVQLVGLRAYHDGPIVGHQLRDLKIHMPKVDTRVAAIFRDGKPVEPNGNTVIETDDEVFFVAAPEHIDGVMAELRRVDSANRRIFIAGGGNIGRSLAQKIEGKYNLKLIERNKNTAAKLAAELKNTIVLHGDAADEDLLLEENIEHGDVFCAVTNDDQANILSAMLAKRLGVKRAISIINRPAYVSLVEETGLIDIALSPAQATIGSLLAHIRRGDVERVHSLRRGAAEAIEAIAHGDPTSSRVVGRMIGELNLPKGVKIGAIVRDEQVLIAHDDVMIHDNDHVILFLVDKKLIRAVEALFQVAALY